MTTGATQQLSTRATEQLSMPESIDSSTGKLVYLYLSLVGGATVAELESRLGLSGMTVLGVCQALEEKAVVRRRSGRYVPAE